MWTTVPSSQMTLKRTVWERLVSEGRDGIGIDHLQTVNGTPFSFRILVK
jgi:hypothetical protein